jgi:hypothetical protein
MVHLLQDGRVWDGVLPCPCPVGKAGTDARSKVEGDQPLGVVLVGGVAVLAAVLVALVPTQKQAEAAFPGYNGKIAFFISPTELTQSISTP